VEYLIEHDPDSPLVEMLTAKIDKYENESQEFAEFNARVASIPSGVALLRTLMDQPSHSERFRERDRQEVSGESDP
jgi:HTH-type transcriptional regulator/antitoxin HigA